MSVCARLRPASVLKCLAAAGLGLSALTAFSATFVKNETQISTQWDLVDAEYSQTRKQIVWSDSVGNLWVAGIDSATGLFVPADGKGTLIDANVSSTADLQVFGNGPEWVSTSKGDQIVYTKFATGAAHTRDNARLGVAKSSDGGVTWVPQFLAVNSKRNAPYASDDAKDSQPRISYVDPAGNHYWRNLNDGTSEVMVTAYPASYRSLRFVRGARAAVFVAPVAGVDQVHRQWLDTGVVEQLTFDAGNKDLHSVPWMWQAPEYANDYVLATIVEDKELRVYRQTDATTPAWEVIYSATTPKNAVLNSPEPFTYKKKSYIYFAAATKASYPTSIWLSNINAAKPMVRQLTDDALLRRRSDPEVFVADDGVYLYFNRFDPTKTDGSGDPNCQPCSEGVWRTYTGLAP